MAQESHDRFARARRELQEAADRFKQRSSTVYGRARMRSEEALRSARTRSREAAVEAQDEIRRRPALAIFTSLVVGLFIGSVFLRRRE